MNTTRVEARGSLAPSDMEHLAPWTIMCVDARSTLTLEDPPAGALQRLLNELESRGLEVTSVVHDDD